MEPTEVKCRFTLSGHNIDHALITKTLGIEPTAQWHEGEPTIKGVSYCHKEDGWAYSTDYEAGVDIRKPLKTILKLFMPHEQKIRDLCEQHDLEVDIEALSRGSDNRPLIAFDKDQVQQIARLGADLGVDDYWVPPRSFYE